MKRLFALMMAMMASDALAQDSEVEGAGLVNGEYMMELREPNGRRHVYRCDRSGECREVTLNLTRPISRWIKITHRDYIIWDNEVSVPKPKESR